MKFNYLPNQYLRDQKLNINHNYLKEQFFDYSKIFKKIEKVVKNGDYTLGKAVDECEKNFKKRTGAKFAISVGNGTDALYLSLKAWRVFDLQNRILLSLRFYSLKAFKFFLYSLS